MTVLVANGMHPMVRETYTRCVSMQCGTYSLCNSACALMCASICCRLPKIATCGWSPETSKLRRASRILAAEVNARAIQSARASARYSPLYSALSTSTSEPKLRESWGGPLVPRKRHEEARMRKLANKRPRAWRSV